MDKSNQTQFWESFYRHVNTSPYLTEEERASLRNLTEEQMHEFLLGITRILQDTMRLTRLSKAEAITHLKRLSPTQAYIWDACQNLP